MVAAELFSVPLQSYDRGSLTFIPSTSFYLSPHTGNERTDASVLSKVPLVTRHVLARNAPLGINKKHKNGTGDQLRFVTVGKHIDTVQLLSVFCIHKQPKCGQ